MDDYTLRNVVDEIYAAHDKAYARRVQGISKATYWAARISRPVHRRVSAAYKSVRMLGKVGAAVRETAGIGWGTQAVQQYQCHVRYGIPPEEYYLYAIYDDYERAGEYVSKKTWGGLLTDLLAIQGTAEGKLLDDKSASFRHFNQHGLPMISTLAEFEDGEMTSGHADGQASFPAADLFSKPIAGREGRGARRWFIQPDGRYKTEEEEWVTQDELLQRLAMQSLDEGILLQRRISNHRQIRELVGPTLVSVRIITMRKPGCKASYLTGLISLPVSEVTASNAMYGAIWAAIEAETGTLGVAYENDLTRVMEPIKAHPFTGEQIVGFKLPDWEEAKALAQRAHDTLPNIALVGWDIGLTDEGPIIIEGNRTPTAYAPQVAHKMPIGATAFPELYYENLRFAQTD